ncbi:MAG: hypothetical protein GY700_13475 [Propionibacteriaceae bacterium]|nr:hypothetical protein [Propionibacteriaceae bacterium]
MAVSDGDIIASDHHNYQDEQTRTIQTWLGENGDLIGDNGSSLHGPSGLASPIADGGTAIKLAAKNDFTSGKLVSIGDNDTAAYSEKASVDFEGKAIFAGIQLGVTTAVTSILDEDSMGSDSATALATQQSIKAYVDTEIAGSVYWDRATTVLSPSTSGDTISSGLGAVGSPGYAFENNLDTGFYFDLLTSELMTSIEGVKTFGIRTALSVPVASIYRVDAHGSGVEIGDLYFYGKNSVGTDTVYVGITAYADDDTSGSEDGALRFYMMSAGSGLKLWEMQPDHFVSATSGGISVRRAAGGPSLPEYSWVGSLDYGMSLDTTPAQDRVAFTLDGSLVAEVDAATPGSTAGLLRVGRWDNHGDVGGDVGVGQVVFMGTDSVGSGYANEVEYGDIRVACTDDATGAEDARMELKIMDGGSSETKVDINPGYTQVNPGMMHTRQTVTSSSNQVNVDISNGFIIYHALTENTTIQPPTGEVEPAEIIFLIDGDGSSTVSFQSGSTAGGFWRESAVPSLGSTERFTIKFIYDTSEDAWVESGRTEVMMSAGS